MAGRGGDLGCDGDIARVRRQLAVGRRWRSAEVLFWVAAVAAFWLLPRQLQLLKDVAILALFALSLDLILGYAGIVSLGHGAFLGFGAYVAGIFAKHAMADPLVGLAVAGLTSAALGAATSPLVLRGTDLTRLMVTLGVGLVLHDAANALPAWTGGADGLQGIAMAPLFGLFAFDLQGRTAYAYSTSVLFLLFLVARVVSTSPFGLSLKAIRDNRLRAGALGIPVNRRLIAIYALAGGYAGVAGALLAQTTEFVSLDVLEFSRSADVMLMLIIGGTGYLYGGMLGALGFKLMQDYLAALTPQYWQFWIGLLLVVFVLGGRARMQQAAAWLRRRLLGTQGTEPRP